MIDSYFSIFNTTLAAGGLFDFNATLMLVAIQFLILMGILNTILYTPLLSIINGRKEYIDSKFAAASELIAMANDINAANEEEILQARKLKESEFTEFKNFVKNTNDELTGGFSKELFELVTNEIEMELKEQTDEILTALKDFIPIFRNQIQEILKTVADESIEINDNDSDKSTVMSEDFDFDDFDIIYDDLDDEESHFVYDDFDEKDFIIDDDDLDDDEGTYS